MPRRKQNSPKRLKSEEEGSDKVPEEGEASSCDSEEDVSDEDGESSSVDLQHSENEQDETAPEDITDSKDSIANPPAESKPEEAEPMEEVKARVEEEDREALPLQEVKVRVEDKEETEDKMTCGEHERTNHEKSGSIKEEMPRDNSCDMHDDVSVTKCEESNQTNSEATNSVEMKNKNTELIATKIDEYKKENKANETLLLEPTVKKPKFMKDNTYDSVPLPKCVKDKTKPHRRTNRPVTPPLKSSGSNPKSGLDSESPISKLLSMVNNPEKIQRKQHSSYSHSFSLPACSLKSSTATPPKFSTSRGLSPASSSTSQSRSSKPLSGFLPPYNMFPSQLHNMYGKFGKAPQPNDDTKSDAKPLQAKKSSQSPQKDQKSSPVPSPAAKDQEQPLDLSVKSKGLDLSIKPSSSELRLDLYKVENGRESSSHKREKHIPRKGQESRSSPGVESSSLRSLEEKFGGNAFRMDQPTQRGPKSYLPYMHPMLSMYGGALYTPALFSTHPWMHTEKLPRSEVSQRKPSTSSTTASPSKSTSQSTNNTERDYSSPPQKLSPGISTLEEELYYSKKYTNLKCSCKKEFETLYELTVHLKQSGHTPSNRVAEQQEFPKLVRGQDMWLNHGSEQTKQILRCIRCGESFKTLPELTIHMMKTKHYTNIVGGSDGAARKMQKYPTDNLDIYKCYQCEESFHGTDEISKHMLSSGHHKSPIVIQPMSPLMSSPCSDRAGKSVSRECSPTRHRSLSESSNGGRVRNTPCTKLSDMKDFDRDDSSVDSFSCEDSKIRCETCGDKIEMSKFVEHVRKCIRMGIWDYGTPLKKRRLDSIDNSKYSQSNDHLDLKRKYSESTTSDRLANGSSSPSSPRPQDRPSKDTLLRPQSDSSNDGSALRAMESFIEKSFTPGISHRDKANLFGFGNIGTRGFAMPHLNGHSEALKPAMNELNNSNGSSNVYSKYLPPLYLNAVEKKEDFEEKNKSETKPKELTKDRAMTPKSQTSSHGSCDGIDDKYENKKPSPVKSPGVIAENNNKPEGKCCTDTPPRKIECEPKKEKISDNEHVNDRTSLTPSPNSEQEKYLNLPEDESLVLPVIKAKVPCQPKSSTTSALESLQGLVYGKSFTDTEHPLDSLQKLIHTTDKTIPLEKQNGATDFSVKNSHAMKGLFTANSLIPSPFLAAFPTCQQSAPNSPCKSESSVSPAPESHTSDRQTPESSENEGRAPSEGDLDKSDSQGEFNCEACSRKFASVGAYRYHTSRCHLSKAKNYQYKENLKKTPYVYLPLDHSAKFNKYYEMANELASKTK